MSLGQGRIPATVITGFLGAGKTSLIHHLLANANGRRIALIVNEFGDVGVDRELLLTCGDTSCTGDDIVELANGCICCTVADDFLPTMQALLARDPAPDHIVIETSGLALPKPLIRAFGWPDVRTRVTVDGVVAVVDAAAVRDGLFATDPEAVDAQRRSDEALDHESPLEELFEEQLASADLVVLNKSDLVEDGAWEEIEARVGTELRPGIRTVRAHRGAVSGRVLIGLEAAAEDDLDSRKSHHDDTGEHEHDDFESFHVDIPPLDDVDAFIARVRRAVDAHGILRVKGFLRVADRPMRLVLQGVGSRLQHHFDRPWSPADHPQLVVIGLAGLDRPAIEAALAG